jgi:hypothetical protein
MELLQNVAPFCWSKKKRSAAQLLAEDRLTDEQIASRLKVARMTLCRWKKHPVFGARVQSLVAQYGAVAERCAIGRITNRVEALDERWLAMRQVIAERAADPSMQDVPGGKSGLLTREIKSVGSGGNAREVEVYRVDTALLKELREHERQAAEELGQWVDRKEITGRDGEPFCKVYLFDPRIPLPEDLVDEPQCLPGVAALPAPNGNGSAPT